MSPSSFQIWQHYLLSATSLMSLYNDILLVYASFLISDKRFTREQVRNLTTQHHHFIYYRNKSVWMQGDWFSCQPYKIFHQKWKENLTKYTRKKKTSLQSSYISSFMNITTFIQVMNPDHAKVCRHIKRRKIWISVL